ncbi:NAD(P)/FAD-dependent oxidoreductase [Nocardia spumae]|uniref:NAD(P)/FAD-dependent oxidoreductase n=1 Tax=Nocardia spumae TaxID=2887190 RepID=UPI001D14E1FB|nr:NAD(P)/FAD-dependent oxidoreductase [Nocardia spumae]
MDRRARHAKQIVVLGGGFAGLWSAVGAARKLDELPRNRTGPVRVTLVDRSAFHHIRVRNYEADLTPARLPLDDVLRPVGVARVQGEAVAVDTAAQVVRVRGDDGPQHIPYDGLVLALGSELVRPAVPGLAQFAFDIDTYDGAARLHAHLASLPGKPAGTGRYTVVVVGAGLTGIEAATEMPARLAPIIEQSGGKGAPRVILADHNPRIGSDMGDSARPVIEAALRELGVETLPGVEIAAVSPRGVELASGELIPAATVVWCAGMRANSLTLRLPVERDRLGRIPVDEYLRVEGVADVFAAGDVARAMVDQDRPSVMSCQHARPMGRIAGHNVVSSMFGAPMIPLRIGWYVTVLDLGAAGAVYTEGWDRRVVATGAAAKETKQAINCARIYPPRTGDRAAILAAAAPLIQQPPETDVDPQL